MRAIIPIMVLLAGCAGAMEDGADPSLPVQDPLTVAQGPIRLVELYDGVVVGANAEMTAISPDQAGDVERGFFVHEQTRNLTLELEADDELTMHVMGPGCHDPACATIVETQGGTAVHIVQTPAGGHWEVAFFKRDPGAAEIPYALHVTKDQESLHAVELEPYSGTVTAAHLGAIRISPDQLGDVYREFWVHEGVANLSVELTVSQDLAFVLGQSDRGRDNDSEESWTTQGGSLSLQFDDPQPGGWYMIFFHHPDGPGFAQIEYTVEISKARERAVG